MSKKRVLIMSVSAGMGHVKAAAALEKTFAADESVMEVINNDALQYTNKLFRDFYSTFYASLVKSAPNFLGWWYKTSDEPWRTDAMRNMIDRLNTKPLVRFIRAFDPDITVCTHFMPAGIISHLIATEQLQAQLSIVVTDFDFHAMWLSRAFHRYFVAIDETKAFLLMLGLPADRITVSGIPIDPAFAKPVDRTRECLLLGLDPAKPILLLSAGALGVSPTDFILEQLLLLGQRAQILVVCGRDEELRRRVERRVRSQQNGAVRVFGYTDEMHRLMKTADLFIGKPGGLTTAEAVASGLPMCVFNPIPGQEERNCDHLLEEGIAIKCNELITLPFKISMLLDDPARMAQMKLRALRFAKPDAAQTVVRTLIEDRLQPLSLSRKEQLAMAETAKLP
ncbi:MAG: glycosyltransferase [Methylomonas sp.]|jgi:processive 1,2-diacylglycerol beta-glucosyltransferase